MRPQWFRFHRDDTDATIVVEVDTTGTPFLYTGSEVDVQGTTGIAYVQKVNGATGAPLWERRFPCQSIRGAHPVNGGMLSTPVLGKHRGQHLAVFSLSRYGGLSAGLLIALDKETGATVWQQPLPHYAWSSPLDLYDEAGHMYIFLADSRGHVMVVDGLTGERLLSRKVADLFEASPVAFGNRIVIASRPRKIFCFELR